jgi:hypothetical protein
MSEAAMADFVASAVRSVFERIFDDDRITASAAHLEREFERLESDGSLLWESHFPEILGPELFSLLSSGSAQPDWNWRNAVPRILAFGSSVARIASSQPAQTRCMPAVLNFAFTTADKILDDTSHSLTLQRILLALDFDAVIAEDWEGLAGEDWLPFQVLFRLLQRVSCDLRRCAQSPESGRVRYVADSISRLLAAELWLANHHPREALPDARTESELQAKSTCPFAALLGTAPSSFLTVQQLDDVAKSLGALFWYLDDLVDLKLDLDRGHWNRYYLIQRNAHDDLAIVTAMADDVVVAFWSAYRSLAPLNDGSHIETILGWMLAWASPVCTGAAA